MNEAMALRFAKYINKVFEFGSLLGDLRDSRPKPQVPTSGIFLSGFFALALRCRSLNAAEAMLRIPGRFGPLLGERVPSADRIGDVYALMDAEPVRAMLTRCARRLGRNKALDSPWPTRWGIVDGHVFFSQ